MFLEIWDRAYNIYIEGDYDLMWKYLEEQVMAGDLSEGDAERIAEDVVGTAAL